jgi:hypothetical protein
MANPITYRSFNILQPAKEIGFAGNGKIAADNIIPAAV